MPNDKKKYMVNPGYSHSTKKGFAHAGAIITADLLTIENAEKYLDKMAEAGKFTIVKNEKQKPKKDSSGPIMTDLQRAELVRAAKIKVQEAQELLDDADSNEEKKEAGKMLSEAKKELSELEK